MCFLVYKEPFADCVALQIHPLIIEKVWQRKGEFIMQTKMRVLILKHDN